MPGTAVTKAAMQAYIDRFNAGDLDGVLRLYADNAAPKIRLARLSI